MTDFHPKKRFGQNFLRDEGIVERIVAAADLQLEDRVLEIGPGHGILTERLLARAATVIAVEVDRELAARLRQRESAGLEVHEGDVLRLDWQHLLPAPPYKLVANLPYNISSQVLFKVLDNRQLFSRLVLMFQKEVADRLCAPPATREYGILTVFCRLWYDVRRVAVVPPGAFSPPPKVTSTVLRFDPLPEPRVVIDDEGLFRRVVKGAFALRRKTLINSLSSIGFTRPQTESVLLRAGIDPGRRGETLELAEFARLGEAFQAAESSQEIT